MPAAYTRVDIPLAYVGQNTADRFVWTCVPAHTVYCSVPWIHPWLRPKARKQR